MSELRIIDHRLRISPRQTLYQGITGGWRWGPRWKTDEEHGHWIVYHGWISTAAAVAIRADKRQVSADR